MNASKRSQFWVELQNFGADFIYFMVRTTNRYKMSANACASIRLTRNSRAFLQTIVLRWGNIFTLDQHREHNFENQKNVMCNPPAKANTGFITLAVSKVVLMPIKRFGLIVVALRVS